MSNTYLGKGDVITIAAPAGGAVKGGLYAGGSCAGVYTDTAASGVNVGVAFEGIFTCDKKTGTGQDFAIGEYVYRLATGAGKAAPVTGAGTKIPLGIAIEAAVTGATTVKVKLSRF